MHASARTSILIAVLMFAAACSSNNADETASPAADAPDTTTTTTTTDAAPPSTTTRGTTPSSADAAVVFNGQGNDLVAYETEPPFDSQVVIRNAGDDPDGRDINGQICFDPADPERFIAGEDTDQSGAGEPGWGIFTLTGRSVGEFEADQVAKLVPTYQDGDDNAENYGCGFLPDGRIVTTDVGNQATGELTGQLIVWFPPFDLDGNRYCKVDIAIGTAQGVLVTDDHVHVAAAREGLVYRYPIAMLPTSDEPDGSCDSTDATGAPLTTAVEREVLIAGSEENGIATPNGIVATPEGTILVSSVLNGVIVELEIDGAFRRIVLEPPAGEVLGPVPFSTGTPLGVGVDANGVIFFADLGLVIDDSGIGPGRGTGTVRRLLPDGQLDVMDSGLAFPDGIGIFTPPAA